MDRGDAEPGESVWGEAPLRPAPAPRVTFDRRELNRILGLYGRKVAAGSRQVKQAGATTVSVQFTKKLRAKLRRQRTMKHV